MGENGGKKNESEKKLINKHFNELVRQTSKTKKETQCGFSIFRGQFLQRFASKKVYVIIHGMVGCFFVATFAYFNGTLTTLEKRYKIPSRNTGVIMVGYDCSAIFMAPILGHYLAKKHRPRWIAFGALTIVIYCFLMAGLHFIYGPGEDALLLTTEYGATLSQNTTGNLFLEDQKMKTLCHPNSTAGLECEEGEGSFAPQVYLFTIQLLAGIFGPVYDSLGFAYMDDNIQKSKTPMLLSVSYFVRMLGPAIGYTIASFALKYYIEPSLHPIITTQDSRWLGAWWLGWIIIGTVLGLFTFLVAFFPKELPRASVRRMISMESQKENESTDEKKELQDLEQKEKDKGMIVTFKRILTNKIFMLNNIAGIFYFFGLVPYWVYTPKYIETQYRQSASLSSFLTGTIALIFTALGILISGAVITKFKPSARYMAAWNVFGGIASSCGIITYIFLGCNSNDNSIVLNQPLNDNFSTCISNCQCDYVKFSPVCGEDGNTYISPCHAGCTEQLFYENGTKYYENCGCVLHQEGPNFTTIDFQGDHEYNGGHADLGWCPVDCHRELILFMIVLCFNKFIGSTGRASNFLISVRCVRPEDKTVSMGIGTTIVSLFSFIPSPIVFGWIIDQTCAVWGKTCAGTGNCWLYDGDSLRYLMNSTAAVAVIIGTLFDCGVWYYVKDLKIFDDEEEGMLSNFLSKKQKEDAQTAEMKSLKCDETEDNGGNKE